MKKFTFLLMFVALAAVLVQPAPGADIVFDVVPIRMEDGEALPGESEIVARYLRREDRHRLDFVLSAADDRGFPVRYLEPGDFSLQVDLTLLTPARASVEVARTYAGEVPLALALIIDNSPSMTGKPFREAKALAAELLEAAAGASVRVFSTGGRVTAEEGADGLQRLEVETEPPQTFLLDALLAGLGELESAAAPGRRAAVVVTDGRDTASSGTVEEIARRAEEADIAVFFVPIGQRKVDEAALERYLEAIPGGRYEAGGGGSALYREIRSAIDPHYKFTVLSSVPPPDDLVHTLKVSLTADGAVDQIASLNFRAGSVKWPPPAWVIFLALGILLILIALTGMLILSAVRKRGPAR